MAITRTQIAKQLLANGGDVLGPLGEDDLKNQLSTGTIGRGLAFVLSGGLTSVPAVAKEIIKQKALDKLMEKSGDIIRPKVQTQLIQQDNRIRGTGGYQSDFAQDSGFMEGKGTSAEMGSFAVGGLADGNFDFESARQMYGLGKLVKKVTRTVKKIAKSPIGKVAIGAAILGTPFGAGAKGTGFFGKKSLFGRGLGFFAKSTPVKLAAGVPDRLAFNAARAAAGSPSSLFSSFPGGGVGAAITAASLLPLLGIGTGEESEEEAEELIRGEGLDINSIRANPNQFLARRFRAEGGSMKEPVAKKTMPLLDMGGKEMDLRAEGGFVPIGRMEKADDVPARLSKNEFVFTADAVRNAGDGDVDKGAEVMYNMMKNLEAGGDVSKESQGLEGARKMFQTSQRLEEVL